MIPGYIGAGLEQPKLRKGFQIRGNRLAFGILLDQHRSSACIYGRGTQQIDSSNTCRYRQRQDEPLPPREAQVQQILYPQEIIRLSRFCILLIYGHIRFYIYFTINTVMVVSSEANDNQKEVDRTLFPLTVDCLALTELGST